MFTFVFSNIFSLQVSAMQSSKRYVWIISFPVLYCFLFEINGAHTQSGQKSREYCYIYRWAGLDPIYFPTIAGGVRVFEYDYPHMAALGYGNANNRKWDCGGSLISENFVLTAAHCLYSRSEGEVKVVRLGTKNVQRPSPGYKDYEISQKIRHPRYKNPQRYDDIALLRLKIKVVFTSKIKPACLEVDTYFNTSSLSATGWGNQGNGQPSSPHLLKVNLVPYNYTVCRPFYQDLDRELPYGIQPQSMICAGGPRDQVKDTCPGDSGGPLQILIDQQYYIVGITSFGRTCGVPNLPAIYTRVSNYIPWIESTAWD